MTGESLRVVSGTAPGTEIKLEEELLIGRSAGGEGTLGDDPELSRRHARVFHNEHGVLMVEDLGSTNGTFVNERQISGRHPLRAGDKLMVGTTTLEVIDPSARTHQPTVYTRGDKTPPAVPRPAAPAPAARAPAAQRAPVEPEPAGRGRPGPKGGGGGPPTAVKVLLPLLLVAAIVAAVLLLTGGDDGDEEVAALTTQQIVDAGRKLTMQIDGTSPQLAREIGAPAQLSAGSGVMVDAPKGLVLTNEHVVAGSTSLKVKLENGSDVTASVVGQAPCQDLAVIALKPPPSGFSTAKLADSAKVKAGDRVVALGYPVGFEGSSETGENPQQRLQTTSGTITAPPGVGELGVDLPTYSDFIQHQAPITGGSSGGPLLNDKAEVVGINTFGSTSSAGQYGAIASNHVKSLLDDLKQGDTQDYVGWHLLPWQATDTSLDKGIVVLSVDAGSPADRARLRSGGGGGSGESPIVGATIFELNNQPVNTISDVCDVLGSRRAGSRLVVTADVKNPLQSVNGQLALPRSVPNTADAVTVDIAP